MEPTQWVQLAEAGAAALIGAMATDAWNGVRDTAARLVGGGREERDSAALTWLEENRRAVAATPEGDRGELVSTLRGQLAGLLLARLNDEPELAAPVERIIAACGHQVPATTVTQHATATRGGRVYQAGRDVTVHDRQPR